MLVRGFGAHDGSLIEFANNLKKGGLYVLGQVVVGDYRDAVRLYMHCLVVACENARLTLFCQGDLCKSYREAWVEYISERSLKAFPEVIIAASQRQGIHQLIMVSIGGRSNCLS